MVEIVRETVHHPSARYRRDLAIDPSWIVRLAPRHLEEIALAQASVKARGLAFLALDKGDFPLPTVAPQLRTWLADVTDGRGFVLVRGLNVSDYYDEDVDADFPQPERRRQMIRLWRTMDERRPLAEGFPPQNGYGSTFKVEHAPQPAG